MNVQESNMSLLKQKNHILLTILSIVLCLALLPVIGSLLLLPQVMTLLPVLLLVLLAYVGPVSMVVCSALLITMTYTLFGGWAALCMVLLLLPTIAATVITFERKESFFTAAAAGCVAMFASLGAMLGLLSVLVGSDVVTALTGIVRDMLGQFGGLSDMMISIFVQTGAVSLPAGYDAAMGIASIDPEVKKEILSSFVLLMDTALRLEIPMQMATGSIAAGLFGQMVVRKGMIRRGAKVEYPALHTWRVPKGWGRILGGTLAALYVLSRLLPDTVSTMFYVFSGIFDQVFALQGIAAICYLLHSKGKKGFLKGLVFVLGYTLLRSPAVMVGIFDQIVDFTHRREKLEKDENPFDPRSNNLI